MTNISLRMNTKCYAISWRKWRLYGNDPVYRYDMCFVSIYENVQKLRRRKSKM